MTEWSVDRGQWSEKETSAGCPLSTAHCPLTPYSTPDSLPPDRTEIFMGDELNSFVPILIYLVLVIGFVVGSLGAAHVLSPFKRTQVKDMPYESGMDPTGDARQHFDVKFY